MTLIILLFLNGLAETLDPPLDLSLLLLIRFRGFVNGELFGSFNNSAIAGAAAKIFAQRDKFEAARSRRLSTWKEPPKTNLRD